MICNSMGKLHTDLADSKLVDTLESAAIEETGTNLFSSVRSMLSKPSYIRSVHELGIRANTRCPRQVVAAQERLEEKQR